MDLSVELLHQRIALLESNFLGLPLAANTLERNPDFRSSESGADSILARIDAISAKLNEVEKEVPELVQCQNLLQTIGPLLSQKRSSIHYINDKVNELLIKKDTILNNVNALHTIKRLEPVINSDLYEGAMIARMSLKIFNYLFKTNF